MMLCNYSIFFGKELLTNHKFISSKNCISLTYTVVSYNTLLHLAIKRFTHGGKGGTSLFTRITSKMSLYGHNQVPFRSYSIFTGGRMKNPSDKPVNMQGDTTKHNTLLYGSCPDKNCETKDCKPNACPEQVAKIIATFSHGLAWHLKLSVLKVSPIDFKGNPKPQNLIFEKQQIETYFKNFNLDPDISTYLNDPYIRRKIIEKATSLYSDFFFKSTPRDEGF